MHTFQNPEFFLSNLIALNDSIFQIMELSREKECEYPNPVFRSIKLKNCYQVAGQFNRPGEFLEALVDMIRVTFQNQIFGTLLLNSNPSFFYDAIPKKPFTLGYLSKISSPKESFSDFWTSTISEKLEEYNYSLEMATSLFVSVAASKDRMSTNLINQVSEKFQNGLSIGDVLRYAADEIQGMETSLKTEVHTGYVWDDNLYDRLRVSLWLIIEDRNLKVVK